MKAQRGFTLIEVLVALALLGLCLGAILTSFSGADRLMRQGRGQSVAAVLARSKLDETMASDNGDIVDNSGEERYNGLVYGYRITTSPVTLADRATLANLPPMTPLEEIRVEVMWLDGVQQRRYVLDTYRLATPAPTPPPGAPGASGPPSGLPGASASTPPQNTTTPSPTPANPFAAK